MSYVRMGIKTSVLYPSVGACVCTILLPSLGVILIRVVGTYILAHPCRTWEGIPHGKYYGESVVYR